ncbi:hypothetical protein ACJ41O_013153 [Fusarium nematophilum]
MRIPPTIIFHRTPTEEGGQIEEKERHLYAQDVIVEFNKTAYNNEEIFSRWIDQQLSKVTSQSEEDFLLVMDAATFHKTEQIKQKLREQNVTLSIIPGGCTSLLQPLDTAINRPFKIWLEEATADFVDRMEEEKGADFKWSVSDKRIMVTHIVSAALQRLREDPEMIQKSFQQCGISIHPDGSEDSLIRIKDMPSEKIDFTGWEHAEEITVKEEDEVERLRAP